MSVADFNQVAAALVGGLTVYVGQIITTLVKARIDWAKGKTSTTVEDAQQAIFKRMVTALAASEVREGEAWAMVAGVRKEKEALQTQIADFREEVARLEEQHATCEARIAEAEASRKKDHDHNHRQLSGLALQVKNLRYTVKEQAKEIVSRGGNANFSEVMGDN